MKFMSKSKAIPLQAWTDPEGYRRLRHPGFNTMPYALAAFTTRRLSQSHGQSAT